MKVCNIRMIDQLYRRNLGTRIDRKGEMKMLSSVYATIGPKTALWCMALFSFPILDATIRGNAI